jgi:hypothetical protein
MLKACISERLLALFTTRQRAAAIVGDFLQLDSGPHRGDLALKLAGGFWLAVMRTAWALSWRFGVGFLLAASAEFFCLCFVVNWAATPPHGVHRVAIFSGSCNALLTASASFSLAS